MEKETIKIRKKAYEIKKVISLTGDMLVPDTKPDIINVVGMNGNSFIKKEEISDSKIRLEGDWNGNVIYLSDLGETKVLINNFEFLENIEDSKITSKDEIEYSLNLVKTDTRILNERKINTSVELEVVITGYKIEDIEIISELEEVGIEKLEKTIVTRKFLKTNFTKTTINEDVNFTDIGKNVEILKSNLIISNIEKKISYNKILAKAEANLDILYLCENQIKKFNTKIPVMSFIEMEDAKEENEIELNYKIRKAKISNNIFEKGCIGCDFEIEITCSMYEKKEIKLIQDLYSLEKDIKFFKQELDMECLIETTKESFDFSEKLNLESIKEIYHYDYCLKKIENVDNKNYEGILNLVVYCSKDENNNLTIKVIDIPFILKNISTSSKFNINFCEVKFNNNEVICDFKVESIENIKYENVQILNKCEFVECKEGNDYSMIIYFVKPYDTIWEISKKFKVSMNQIIDLNNLSEPEKLNIGEKLYIMKG